MPVCRRGNDRLWAAAFLLAVLAPSGPRAAVLEVPGAFPTVEAAVAAAADGDTILVAAGVYVLSEPLRFNDESAPPGTPVKNLELRSVEGPERTVLRLGSRPARADSSVL